jgi:hypothetical protein
MRQRQCEFFLLRYVPNALRDEFVNIGVVLREPGTGEATVRFARDWKRVRGVDPDADTELLDALAADVQQRLHHAVDRETLLQAMQESFSSTIQLSPKQGVLAESMDEEVRRLADVYVEAPPAEPERRAPAGRAAILARMRSAFDLAGVWDIPQMAKNIAVAPYTRAGDPLKLDCGYQPNGVIKLFHAVSLEADPNLAKVLAFTFPQVRDGIARMKKADASLTAIVETGLDQGREPIAFAVETLAAAQVKVATTAQMNTIAETARKELRV